MLSYVWFTIPVYVIINIIHGIMLFNDFIVITVIEKSYKLLPNMQQASRKMGFDMQNSCVARQFLNLVSCPLYDMLYMQ